MGIDRSKVDLSELRFEDITPIEIPVLVGEKQYVLKEAMEYAANKYRNAVLRCMELGSGGNPKRIAGMADTVPLLISLCLFDEQGRSVSVRTITQWPAHVCQTIFEKVREISNLEEEEEKVESVEEEVARLEEELAGVRDRKSQEELAKNSLSSTEDGSG